ncbi:MAG: acyltransferase family protein [Verrucomicrobiota bacterium]
MAEGTQKRFHEIDALRVIALFLLIVYHVFVAYQPFAPEVWFVQYKESLADYWFLGEWLNIWRIPILFVISGISLGFIARRRSIKEILIDRIIRLEPPLFFGCLCLCPLLFLFYLMSVGEPLIYLPHPAHLWYVLFLVSYVFLSLPLIAYLKRHPNNRAAGWLKRHCPWVLWPLFAVPLALESVLFEPEFFSAFYNRYWYGFVCFLAGYGFIYLGEIFWNSVRSLAPLAVVIGGFLYLLRMEAIPYLGGHPGITALESATWMIAFLGLGYRYLNRPNTVFSKMNAAIFPIYILHLPVQQAIALGLFQWNRSAELTFFVHLALTLGCSILLYGIVRKIGGWLNPLMGINPEKPSEPPIPSRWAQVGSLVTIWVLTPITLAAGIFFMLVGSHLLANS